MDNVYYLPIKSSNLPFYYQGGCINPSEYLKSRDYDIQEDFGKFLFLSKKMWIKDTDCSLELVLTQNEIEELIEYTGAMECYLFAKPLPISRVKYIHFLNEGQKDSIITFINLSTAFTNNNIKVTEANEFVEISKIDPPSYPNNTDWTGNIRRFDSILGAFALMRLTGDKYMNYSRNYFGSLAHFNAVIENELLNNERADQIDYFDLFNNDPSLNKIKRIINKNVTETDIEMTAKEEKQRISKDPLTGIIDIKALEGAAYIVAVLYTYGVGAEARKKKIDSLIASKFTTDIRPEKREVIAFCYGLNRGYSAFNNKYGINRNFESVKFELNSLLDYYTIESIYQYAFNDVKKSDEFPYLDSWWPQVKTDPQSLKKNQYLMLDKVINDEVITFGSQQWVGNTLNYIFKHINNLENLKPIVRKLLEIINVDILDQMSQQKNETLSLQKDEAVSLQKRYLEFGTQIKNIYEANKRQNEENSKIKSAYNSLNREISQLKDKLASKNSEHQELYNKTLKLEEENKRLKESINLIADKVENLIQLNDQSNKDQKQSKSPRKPGRKKKDIETSKSEEPPDQTLL